MLRASAVAPAPDAAVASGLAPALAPVLAPGGAQSGPLRAHGTSAAVSEPSAQSSFDPVGSLLGGGSPSQPPPPPPPPAPAPAPTPGPNALHGPLSTSGNQVFDANGLPVVLRGINRAGLANPYGDVPITDAEIGHAMDWGANVVRLSVAEAYTNAGCSNYLPNYLSEIDAAVQSVTGRGMVALIDLNAVTRVPCGQSGAWRMADAGSIDFWKTVAGRYKSNPLVAFDLYNEPNNITNDQWRNGGVLIDYRLMQPAVTWTAAGMQQMLDAVRSTGASNLVTVSGNSWAGDPSPILDGHALTGTNIVYAIHAYTCPHDGDTTCMSKPANQTQHIDPRWLDVAATYPVMITEFGWPSPWNGTYNDSVIQFAKSQSPQWGWAAFTWDGTQNGGFGLVGNLQTYDPTPAGQPVKAALSAAP